MAPALADNAIMELLSLLESEAGVAVAAEMAPTLAFPWSAEFSTRFLALVRGRLQTGTDATAYEWSVTLGQSACAISASTFPLALAPWKLVGADESTTWFAAAIAREIEKFTTTIEKRQSFLKELDE